MASKMFLDIVGVITTSKLSILSTFQGGAVSAPPPCQVGLRYKGNAMGSQGLAFIVSVDFKITIAKTFLYSSNQ